MYLFAFSFLYYFQSVTAESIGATEFLNYTEDSVDMYRYVQSVDSPSQCCNYSYQILDKFCARQAVVSYSYSVSLGLCYLLLKYFKGQLNCEDTRFRKEFGYRRCLQCLA